MAEREHDDIPGLGKVLRDTTQPVVAQIQGHKVTNCEDVCWHPRVLDVIVVGIQYLQYTIHTHKKKRASL